MISLSNVSNFTDQEKAKLNQALGLVNLSLIDLKFIDILMHEKFDNTNDTNAEIVANLQKNGSVSSIDIERMSWWSNHVSKTIAYEVNEQIVLNRYYFEDETIAALANTILHEWCHACGYSHASSTDYQSVPYGAGNALEDYLEARN